MSNVKKKQVKGEKGITLVALVITVVVMLILAGVAIATVVDGDGLFSKTRQATELYENVTENEEFEIHDMVTKIDIYLQETNNPIVKTKAEINTIVDENQTYDGRLKGTYYNPIIPKGFAPINENGADWGTDEGYKYGLLIQDIEENQFVWVPVDGAIVKLERYNFGKQAEGTQYSDYLDPESQEINNIITSIEKNGGFYIARYEAGIAKNMPQKELNGNSSMTYGNGTYKPVSKKDTIVWNNIHWGDTSNDDSPGNGAVTVARSMYLAEDENYGVTSTLIYGIQWDTTLKFIEAYGGDPIYAIDSTGKGNYSGTNGGDTSLEEPDVCGALEAFKQKNIYDMAGNIAEWTMEQCRSENARVPRGGRSGLSSGLDYPASFRNGNSIASYNSGIGFRVALYIK